MTSSEWRADASHAGGPYWTTVAILALLSALCCAPLLAPGWFSSHEEIRPIARALGAWYEIADGDLYPRWISSGYLGKGVPLLNFYPPAFSLLVAYGHALGIPLLFGAKATIFALFLVGALGAYQWARPHLGHFAALVVAILYLFAPYHFVDLYVRGATAEFTSLAALPWLFRAMDRLVDRLTAGGLASLAVASAAVVFSHFLGALMIAPFAVVYALARVASTRGGWAALGRIVAGGALGAALSAFFWLPALVERDALSPDGAKRVVSGYFSYPLHFVHPRQWLDPTWGFGSSVPFTDDDGMSFQVGILTLAAIVASVALAPRVGRPARRFLLLSLGLGLGALWLTSSASAPWYAALPPYQMVQFPWRFLGPATVFLAAAGGGFASVLVARMRWLGPALAAATAVLAVALSADQRAVLEPLPVADERAAIEAAVAADPWSAKFGNEDEFLPKDANAYEAVTTPGGPFPRGLGVEIGAVRERRTDLTFEVTVPVGQGLTVVPWYVFPGWGVTLDGREWPFAPGPDGTISFLVPEGRHVARVRFGTTPPRVLGWLLALAGLGTLGALALRERSGMARGAGA